MRRSILAPLLALGALPLAAQAPLWTDPGAGSPGAWTFRAGAMAFASPAFPGSSKDRFLPLPVFSADYDGRVFLGSSLVSVGLGAGLRVVKSAHFSWDLGLGVGERRPERRADELAGMGDRSPEAFLGTGVRVHGGGFQAAASVASGLVQGAGARGTLSFGGGGRVSERMLAGLGLSGVWGNAQNLAWDYGITPEQAARRAGLLAAGDARLKAGEAGPYAPKGGLKEVAATGHLVLLLPARWQLFWVLKAGSLHGDARTSPLVRRASFASGGMGCSVRF